MSERNATASSTPSSATWRVSDESIQARQVEHFYGADPELGHRVAEDLGLDVERIVHEGPLAVPDGKIRTAERVADLV